MAILVTGGAGFIGSHTCVELLDAGYDVVVYDNLYNASEKSLERVKELTGKEVTFVKGDILDPVMLEKVFTENKIESVIHFAGLKAVGESVAKPWEYYNNNMSLLDEDVSVASVLEGEEDQVHSFVQGHDEAGHGGLGEGDRVTVADLFDPQRNHGAAGAHDVAVTGAANFGVP